MKIPILSSTKYPSRELRVTLTQEQENNLWEWPNFPKYRVEK